MGRQLSTIKQKVSRQTLLLIGLGVGLFVFLLYIYGAWPGHLTDLTTFYRLTAPVLTCMQNQAPDIIAYCQNFGQPIGFPSLQGLPFMIISYLVSLIIPVGNYGIIQITSALFVLLALGSSTYLLIRLGSNKYVALIFSFLYVGSYALVGQAGFGFTIYGYMLVPLFLLADVILISKLDVVFTKYKHSFWLWVFGFVAIKVFAIFLDGYGFMLSAVGSFVILLAFAFRHRSHIKKALAAFFLFVLAYGLSYLLYKLYLPGGITYSIEPLDLFRAQGADIYSFFKPDSLLAYADWLDIGKPWNGYAYYGDSTNTRFNYLGFSLIATFIFFAYRVRKSFTVKALVVAGLIALALSFGPSLKINDHREPKGQPVVTYQDYMMPVEDATLNLHTGMFYQNIPGVNNFRAVYRWATLFRLVLFIGAALGVTYLIKKKHKMVAFLVVGLIVIELFPSLGTFSVKHINAFNTVRSFTDDPLVIFQENVQEGSSVLFLSNENDFLANYIAADANVLSYNTGNDKNSTISRSSWPEAITTISNNEEPLTDTIHGALEDGLIDVLVVPYFSLRWHSYRWPPSPAEQKDQKDKRLSNINTEDGRLDFVDTEWFGFIRLAD